MTLSTNLKRGRELLMSLRGGDEVEQTPVAPAPAVEPEFPALAEGEEAGSAYREALRRALTQKAMTRLRDWNAEAAKTGQKYDYSAERSSLIQAYADTCTSQTPAEYVERNAPYSLGVPGESSDGNFGRLDFENRREVIVDTVARWLWLEKRVDPNMPRRVTAYDVRAAADSAMDAEVARLKGGGRGKRR